jgi:hypothetical protein
MRWMPSVEEERLALARQRAGLRDTGEWRRSRLIPRAIFFVLTLVGVGAFAGLLNLLGFPQEALTAIAAIAVAELLIRGKRLFHAGPEEALWIAGMVSILFALPGSPEEETLLLFAAVFVAAGIRVRNALFIAAAAPLVCIYIGLRVDRVPGSFLALAIGFAALGMASREWRDPLIERLLSWLVVAMPLVAWAIDAIDRWRSDHWPVRAAIGLVVAAILISVGVYRRHRATIIGGALSAAVSLFDLDQRLSAPGELRFLLWGVGLFVLTLAIIRALRKERGGITSAKIEELEGYALAEVAAASVATPRSPESPRPIGQGGGYGGGGASGEY